MWLVIQVQAGARGQQHVHLWAAECDPRVALTLPRPVERDMYSVEYVPHPDPLREKSKADFRSIEVLGLVTAPRTSTVQRVLSYSPTETELEIYDGMHGWVYLSPDKPTSFRQTHECLTAGQLREMADNVRSSPDEVRFSATVQLASFGSCPSCKEVARRYMPHPNWRH